MIERNANYQTNLKHLSAENLLHLRVKFSKFISLATPALGERI